MWCLQVAFVSSLMIFDVQKGSQTTPLSIHIRALCIRKFYLEIWCQQVVLDNSTMEIYTEQLHLAILLRSVMPTGGISKFLHDF